MFIYLRDAGSYSIKDKPFPRGEIVVVGDAVFRNYYGMEEDPQNAQIRKELNIKDDTWGIYCSGDVGQFNFITGELEIIDRINNIIKLSQGEFVQLAKIEEAVGKYPITGQCYMYGKTFMNSIIGVISVKEKIAREHNSKSGYLELLRKVNQELPGFLKTQGLRGF